MTPALLVLAGCATLLVCLGAALWLRRRTAQHTGLVGSRLERLRPRSMESMDARDRSQPISFAMRLPRWARVRLARADIEPTWQHVTLPLVGLGVVDGLIVSLFNPLIAVAVTGVAMLGAVWALQIAANRRLDGFIDAMPPLFDLIKHLLLAGNSLQQGLIKAIDSSGMPVQRYLRPVARRVQNGAPVADSILLLADRLDVPELFIFGTGVQTNARYGGRMSTMLGNLAQIVRDGARVRRELRSATAETRLSAIVLSLLPIGTSGIIAVANPSYMRFFVDTQQGQHMAMFAVGMQIFGMLIMRRILRLDF